ncbi:MAG: phytanoyl-CoA dioxygenase family protein [Rhodospirillaceae bacterium]|jgi:2-aminoethylphosphonate dioxygenase|nr:phytanoyl-CoA dioxygenase family protein [Rhodospirillaceae bacterium]MBT4463637.1 phytanoyl-CoA dioxygenase family protein [Rhodospirillaceae bacterium]MBT5013612.1 phytanoyl-CoA dioxygenase family protein [Rhodospirillaceae bacterium]MBT5309589.1 phytanoyl-CoA dioxygenase family protein [Rhodospirillaceae bacterium]
MKTPILSNEQIKAFKNDGYVVLRGGFDADEMTRVEQWASDVETMPEETGKQWVYHEKSLTEGDKDLICRIENISPFHNGFEELTEVLKAPVGQLLGEEAALFKEKINFKMPGGDGFKPHQDSQAGWDKYAEFFISVLVCIDEATVENGCLQMVAGNHTRGLYRSWEPLTEDDMADMDFVHCPTKPGDIVFFDCYAPHASDPNTSDKTRRIYFATYNKLSEGDHLAQYYADKHENYPPDIDRLAGKDYVYRV